MCRSDDRHDGQRVRQALGGQRGAVDGVDGEVDLRPGAVADVLAVVEHRRFVLLTLADDDGAAHGDRVQHRAHGVDRGLVDDLLVAAPEMTGGGERSGLGGADELEREVAVDRGPGWCSLGVSWGLTHIPLPSGQCRCRRASGRRPHARRGGRPPDGRRRGGRPMGGRRPCGDGWARGRSGGNSRNGRRSKTVLTEVGPVEIDVPRDRDGSFEPKIVRQAATAAVRGRRAGALAVGEGADHRRGAGPPGRGLRRRGLAADHLHDHRQGRRGHGRVAEPAARPGLSGGLHRRDQRQDPRREGRQPAHLRRARGHLRGPPGDPRAVGRGAPSVTGGRSARAPSTGCTSSPRSRTEA